MADTSSFCTQPAKRVLICASPRSLAAIVPVVRSSPPSASRLTVPVRMPMSWMRSGVRSIGMRPATPGRASAAGAVLPPPDSFGTSVMLQIGHEPGWSWMICGCIGQV